MTDQEGLSHHRRLKGNPTLPVTHQAADGAYGQDVPNKTPWGDI